MASKQEPTISLKYWVDEEENRVIVAEASGEFVDVLFSFLTLPLGTITRPVTTQQSIGCIYNLYHSVETFETNVFWNNICKKMLLSPRNPLEASCQRLKVKVDDTEHTRYFVCASCLSLRIGDTLVSTFAGASCNRCGKSMSKQVQLFVDPKDEVDLGNGVFVKRDAMFFIFDDLRVLESSPGNTVHQLLKLGYNDFNKLTQKSLNFGMKEMFSILKKALTSKTPLSDVLLANRESETMHSLFSPNYSLFSPNFGLSHHRCAVKLKLTVRKSDNEILFAEAGGDFMDFLFSFLTIPLGSILNLMNGKLSLGSIDNLYQSVKKLNSSWFIGSSNNSLLNPRVPPQFGCLNQPLNVAEQNTPSYWYGTKEIKGIKREVISRSKDMIQDAIALKLFDPRCSDGARGPAVGFMKRPCLFVVRDDLQVKPMTTTSSINFVHDLGLPLDDFEEYSVEIKNPQQALNLLGFSLTSNAALTKSLFHLVKTRKCVMSILRCTGWRKEGQGMKERNEKKKEKEEEKILKSDDKEKEDEVERKETEQEITSLS